MNLGELKELTLYQLGQEKEDEKELQPHLNRYLNEAYRMLMSLEGVEEVDILRRDSQSPLLPEWSHQALADWACYRFCLCGSARKQQKAAAFFHAYEQARNRMLGVGKGCFQHWA